MLIVITINIAADKAYLSRENLEAVDRLGGTAYIPFKVNSVPDQSGTLWAKLYHYYAMNWDEFMAKYHLRSNVESVFSMVKAKFRDHVRAMTPVAMQNEVLCKLVCHNICCLIMSQFELGIEPLFWECAATETRKAEVAGKSLRVEAMAPVEKVAPIRHNGCVGA